jgi:hypothetical protein
MPKKKPAPQFDAEPLDDDEAAPFTLDEDGNMTLRRSETPAQQEGKREADKPSRRRC